MIKWTFGYADTHIAIDVMDEAEDKRIAAALAFPEKLLFIPGLEGREAYININMMTVAIRQILPELIKETPADALVPVIENEDE